MQRSLDKPRGHSPALSRPKALEPIPSGDRSSASSSSSVPIHIGNKEAGDKGKKEVKPAEWQLQQQQQQSEDEHKEHESDKQLSHLSVQCDQGHESEGDIDSEDEREKECEEGKAKDDKSSSNEDDVEDEKESPTNGTAPVSSHGEPKGPPQACLFVASLSPDTTEEVIREFFSRHGTVLKAKVLKDRSSRPYAFVQFLRVDEANEALQAGNNAELCGRRLRVEKAKVNRTLFIAKMSKNLTNQKLREIVEPYGPVESVTIIKNHITQKSKGCGFVKFVYREDAMDAFLGLKNNYRKWVVEWATSSNDPEAAGVDKLNIFIGGLNSALVTKKGLEERFQLYGPIENTTLIKRDDSEDGGRSAFAFIRYKNPSSSASAIEQENGADWLERRIRVQYCESMEMKNKRRTQKYLAMGNIYQSNNQFFSPGVPYTPPLVMYPIQQSFSPYSARKVYSEVQSFYPPAYPGAYPYNPMLAYNQPWLYSQGLPDPGQGAEELGQMPDGVRPFQEDFVEPGMLGAPQLGGSYEIIIPEERPPWGASDHA